MANLSRYRAHLRNIEKVAFELPYTEITNWDVCFHDAIIALPTHTAHHARLFRSLYSQSPENAQTLINTLLKKVNIHLELCQFSKSKPILRIIVQCIDIINGGWERLIEVWKKEIQDDYNTTERRDWAAWMLMDSIAQVIFTDSQ
jgi:hypothetical protein